MVDWTITLAADTSSPDELPWSADEVREMSPLALKILEFMDRVVDTFFDVLDRIGFWERLIRNDPRR